MESDADLQPIKLRPGDTEAIGEMASVGNTTQNIQDNGRVTNPRANKSFKSSAARLSKDNQSMQGDPMFGGTSLSTTGGKILNFEEIVLESNEIDLGDLQ
jgi:hypothetical protein